MSQLEKISSIYTTFLQLVRLGIGTLKGKKVSNDVDWVALKALADRHGLTAIVLDGVNEVLKAKSPISNLKPQIKLSWIGEVMQNYEQRYAKYKKAISSLAKFYNQYGYKMMVLKGYACSLDWPNPKHRPCGDIDIWLFGKQKEADAALAASSKFQDSSTSETTKSSASFKIDSSHHHHTVFDWHGFTVENHYDFVNVHAHKSSAELEKIFKQLGQDDSHAVEVNGEMVYLPSPNLHALFLIRHMVSHFAAAEITLRQLLDWAFFVEKHTKELDWNWLNGMLVKYHMKYFFNLINAICVEDLGFSVNIFPSVQFVPELKERVLEDILDPEYTAAEPCGFLPRVIYKYQRWQGNAWKQEMCYGESRWSAFWSGIWAKILKPFSI